MNANDNMEVKDADEIALLVKQLNQTDQLKILSTVNAFLYSQQVQKEKKMKDDLQRG